MREEFVMRIIMNMKTGYLIDMDGVDLQGKPSHRRGGGVRAGAYRPPDTPFLFLTNNSAPTPEDLVVRLKHLGIHGLSRRHFYTSALNTADFLCAADPALHRLRRRRRRPAGGVCMNRRFPTTPSGLITSSSAKGRFRWKN